MPNKIPEFQRLLARGARTAVILAALHTCPLAAQSILRGGLNGAVEGSGGGVLAGVQVVVIETRSGRSTAVQTARDGSFAVEALSPGEYQLRLEARGYRPQVLTGLRVAAGASLRVRAVLRAEPPPVERVDTVIAPAVARARFDGLGGFRASFSDLTGLAPRWIGWSGVAALSPSLDLDLAAEGQPPSGTGVLIDGLPFTPASHPSGSGAGEAILLLPSLALEAVDIQRSSDVEWVEGSGTQVALTSRPGGAEAALELSAGGSAGGLWNSEAFTGAAVPDASSGWAGFALNLPMASESSQLRLAVEAMDAKVPHRAPLGIEGSSTLDGLVGQQAVGSPWLEHRRALAASARVGWTSPGATEIVARSSFATFESSGGDLFGRSTADGATGPFSGTDLFLSASVFTPGPLESILELKAGVAASARSWGPEEGGAVVPPSRLVQPGVLLGQEPGRAGSVNRVAAVGALTGHLRLAEQHLVKGGITINVPWHEIEHLGRVPGEFVAGDEQRLTAGEYLFTGADRAAPSQSFTVPEGGVFLQYQWEPGRTLRIASGVRVDYEGLPTAATTHNARWTELTGLRNDSMPKQLMKLSPRVSVEWDPTATGGTVFRAAFGIHHGRVDPGALHEVLGGGGSVAVRLELGVSPTWPNEPTVSQARPTLSLFGPRLEAPRTARGTLGLSQRVGGSTVLHLWGTVRTTRLLLRRTDLNRSIQASGRTSEDRPLYGGLVKLGSAVVAAPGSDRRFTEFDAVWALTADGWSRYRGGSIALERRSERGLDFFAHYTYSLTEDNLPGAGSVSPEARVLPALDQAGGGPWERAVSDFDAPHRAGVGARLRLPLLAGTELTGVYRFRSGSPYTAGYRAGVDVNGDGSWLNDPALVRQDAGADHPCLGSDVGTVASRNGCRSPGVHGLDAHLSVGLFRVGASVASLTVDLFNLLDAELGRPDAALYLVREDGVLARDEATGFTSVPLEPNPDFGTVRESLRPGRLARIGVRLALP